MVSMFSLIWPILVAAGLVFLVSSIVWMVLPHHKSDFNGLPDEDAVLAALGTVAPGAYDFPHMISWDEARTPEMKARFQAGPVGFFTVAPGAEYLAVFRITAPVAWAAYGFATISESIWFARPWMASS